MNPSIPLGPIFPLGRVEIDLEIDPKFLADFLKG